MYDSRTTSDNKVSPLEPFLRACSALSHLTIPTHQGCTMLPMIPNALQTPSLREPSPPPKSQATLLELLRSSTLESLSSLRSLRLASAARETITESVKGKDLLEGCEARGMAAEFTTGLRR